LKILAFQHSFGHVKRQEALKNLYLLICDLNRNQAKRYEIPHQTTKSSSTSKSHVWKRFTQVSFVDELVYMCGWVSEKKLFLWSWISDWHVW